MNDKVERLASRVETIFQFMTDVKENSYSISNPHIAGMMGVEPATTPDTSELDGNIGTLQGLIARDTTLLEQHDMDLGTTMSNIEEATTNISHLTQILDGKCRDNLRETYTQLLKVEKESKEKLDERVVELNNIRSELKQNIDTREAEVAVLVGKKNDLIEKSESSQKEKVRL